MKVQNGQISPYPEVENRVHSTNQSFQTIRALIAPRPNIILYEKTYMTTAKAAPARTAMIGQTMSLAMSVYS